MTTDFYRCSNDPIEFNKKLEIITRGNVYYKEDTDMEKPDFILDSDKWIDGCNYIYVGGSIKRYYFVNGIDYSQGKIIMKCSEDYLASHRAEILKLSGIVERNAFLWNMYLTDTKLKTFNMSRIQTFPWEGGFLSKGNKGKKEASYVLTISGGGEDEEDEDVPVPVPDGGGE